MCTDGTVLNKLGCCGTLMKGKPDKTHPYHMCTARSSSGIDIGGFKYTCKSKNKETWNYSMNYFLNYNGFILSML